jgi:hypothetical protein
MPAPGSVFAVLAEQNQNTTMQASAAAQPDCLIEPSNRQN